MLNLIVFLQSFFGMFVGFNVKVECVKLVKNCEEQGNSRLARKLTTCSRSREKYTLEAEKSSVIRHPATHFATWPTHEMTRKMHC